MVLISISLITDYVEYNILAYAIFMSSLDKSLFKSSAHIFDSSFYILDTSYLSDMYFAHIFFYQSVTFLLIILAVLWQRKVLDFAKVKFIIFFSLMGCAFGVISKNSLFDFLMFSSKNI